MHHKNSFYRTLYSLLAVALFFFMKTPAAKADALAAPRLQSPIHIDGKLDEPAWKNALVSTPFVYLETAKLDHAPAATEVRLLTDDNAVYVGIRCEEPLRAQLQDALIPRDGAVWGQDCVEVFLSPTGQKTAFYHFMVGASGTQFDNYMVENGRLEGSPYSAIWQSAVYKGADYWSAEIRIPLSAFPFTNSSQFSSTWLVNVTRERKPVAELTSWAPVYQAFNDPQKYFQVSGMPRKPAALDLQIVSGTPVVEAVNGVGGSGAITLQTNASTAAAGDYHYQIKNTKDDTVIKTGDVKILTGDHKIDLSDVPFATLGNNTFQIELQKPVGVTATGTYLTSNLVFEPLQVDLTEPFYAGCIFPDQQIKRIEGSAKVHLLPNQLRGAALLTTLSNSDGSVVSTSKSTFADDVTAEAVPFKLDVAVLLVGDYTLDVQVQKNNQTLTKTSIPIHKLAPPTTGSSVRVDRNLNLVVNGKTIFPRTWMGDQTYLVSKTLQDEMHFPPNFVNLWSIQVNADPRRLDPADSARMTQDVLPSQKVFDGLKQSYEQNRDRKDGWVYYLADEPEGSSMSLVYLKHCYDYIKKMDPYHPVQIVSHAPQNYTTVADIITPDSYIDPQIIGGKRRLGTPMEVVRQNVTQALAASDGHRAVWDMPQAFSYAGPDGGILTSENPTLAEFRCSVYDAVANGAKGIMPYLYSSHFASWDLRYGVPFVFESLERLEPMLVAPQQPMAITVEAPDNGVDVWAKDVDGKVLLIAVNILDKPVTARINSAGLKKVSQLESFREAGSKPVKNGELTLQFAPYQVHVLSSEKMDNGLRSISDVQQQIDIANANREKTGNILYGRGKEIVWSASDDYMVTRSLWTLTDGITDDLGWKDMRSKKTAAIEMAFPTFTPRFNEAKIYSSTVQDLEFYIWKAGEWQLAGQVQGHDGPVIDLHFDEVLSTVKIKIVMPKALPGYKAELNEIELYNTDK